MPDDPILQAQHGHIHAPPAEDATLTGYVECDKCGERYVVGAWIPGEEHDCGGHFRLELRPPSSPASATPTPEEHRVKFGERMYNLGFREGLAAAYKAVAGAPVPAGEAGAQEVARAISDIRWYALRLCRDNPERYEVKQTRHGVETTLADACVTVLTHIAALESALSTAEERATRAEQELHRVATEVGMPEGWLSAAELVRTKMLTLDQLVEARDLAESSLLIAIEDRAKAEAEREALSLDYGNLLAESNGYEQERDALRKVVQEAWSLARDGEMYHGSQTWAIPALLGIAVLCVVGAVVLVVSTGVAYWRRG